MMRNPSKRSWQRRRCKPLSSKGGPIMQTDRTQAIACLLRETESAHGEYEASALDGAYDENWPVWYAAYLLDHGVAGLLAGVATPSPDTLAHTLKALEREQKQQAPDTPWFDYYAQHLAPALDAPQAP